MKSYASYTLSDLISDPFFQEGVIHPNGEAAAFWQDWTRQNPEKAALISEARTLLHSLRFEEQSPSEEEIQLSLQKARASINGGQGKVIRLPANTRRIRRIGWAAAVVILVAGAATIAYFPKVPAVAVQANYATNYGEQRTVYLPDSSKLILNAHSTVRYAANWGAAKIREVWLEGEGYFDVRPYKAMGFEVHTKDLTVAVLGTTFDIRNRRNKTEVVLETGKIKVSFSGQAHEDVVMAPNDKIVYDPEKVELAHAVTLPANYTSWKDKKLTEATVDDILQYLEDNYHKKFILEDPTLGGKRIGGVILLDNLNDALFALSTVLNVNIIQHQDTIILKKRRPVQ